MDELSSSRVGTDQFGSQSSWKPVESSKKPAASQESNIKSGAEKNGTKGLEQHHSRYLQSLYKSIPERVKAALDAQDSEAKYWMRFDMFEVHF